MESLYICIDKVENDFVPISSGINFENDCSYTVIDIFIFLANLQFNNQKYSALLELERSISCPITTPSKELNDELTNKISSITPVPFIRFFVQTILEAKKHPDPYEESDIKAACYLANTFAELVFSAGNIDDPKIRNTLFMLQDAISWEPPEFHPVLGTRKGSFVYIPALKFQSLKSLVRFSLISIIKDKKPIRKCRNCGLYFVPRNRTDEIYCDHVQGNGKTCKEMGYEIKIKDNAVISEYRKIYKTQNARKARNRHIPNIDNRFIAWANQSKAILSSCKQGLISVEEMRMKLESKSWMKGELDYGEYHTD